MPYNGGLGEEQLAWLRAELAAAAAAAERVVIMCHVILHPKACGGGTMVWDYPEALEVLGLGSGSGLGSGLGLGSGSGLGLGLGLGLS